MLANAMAWALVASSATPSLVIFACQIPSSPTLTAFRLTQMALIEVSMHSEYLLAAKNLVIDAAYLFALT